MPKRLALTLTLCCAAPTATAQARPPVPLVVVSIDGFHTSLLADAERFGAKLPELRRLWGEGAHASPSAACCRPSHTRVTRRW